MNLRERPIHLLLIDDDPADQLMAVLALEQQDEAYQLSLASSSAEVLAAFQGPRERWPELVLLDLALPGTSGLQLLAQLRRAMAPWTVSVVMLTHSELDADIQQAYDDQVSAYLVKPRHLATFSAHLEALLRFWRHAVLINRVV